MYPRTSPNTILLSFISISSLKLICSKGTLRPQVASKIGLVVSIVANVTMVTTIVTILFITRASSPQVVVVLYQPGESVVYALQVSEPEIRHHCFYQRMNLGCPSVSSRTGASLPGAALDLSSDRRSEAFCSNRRHRKNKQ